jgi:hypothetical protein
MIQLAEMTVSKSRPFTIQQAGQLTIYSSKIHASLAGKLITPYGSAQPLKNNDAGVIHSLILLNAGA